MRKRSAQHNHASLNPKIRANLRREAEHTEKKRKRLTETFATVHDAVSKRKKR